MIVFWGGDFDFDFDFDFEFGVLVYVFWCFGTGLDLVGMG